MNREALFFDIDGTVLSEITKRDSRKYGRCT